MTSKRGSRLQNCKIKSDIIDLWFSPFPYYRGGKRILKWCVLQNGATKISLTCLQILPHIKKSRCRRKKMLAHCYFKDRYLPLDQNYYSVSVLSECRVFSPDFILLMSVLIRAKNLILLSGRLFCHKYLIQERIVRRQFNRKN